MSVGSGEANYCHLFYRNPVHLLRLFDMRPCVRGEDANTRPIRNLSIFRPGFDQCFLRSCKTHASKALWPLLRSPVPAW